MVPGNSTVLSRSLLNLQHLFLKPSETGKVHIYIYTCGCGSKLAQAKSHPAGAGGYPAEQLPWGAHLRRAAGPTCEHLWCSASARCVPPGSCFQGAHGLGRWLPTLLGGVPKRSSWPRRACMGRPRATFSGRHKSFPMQFLAARADWSQAPPGFDHLLERQLVSAVGHPLASP